MNDRCIQKRLHEQHMWLEARCRQRLYEQHIRHANGWSFTGDDYTQVCGAHSVWEGGIYSDLIWYTTT